MDWKALKLWDKNKTKTFSSHTASARYSVTVTRWLLQSQFTSPEAWALVQQMTPLHSTDHSNKRLIRENRHSSYLSQPGNFLPSFVRHIKFFPTCWWYFKPLLLLEGSTGLHMSPIPTKKLLFLSSDDHRSITYISKEFSGLSPREAACIDRRQTHFPQMADL